jgi:membrane protease YdiL (CAAX protease family)
MPFSGKISAVYGAVVCSLALMLFSFFVSFEFPVKLVAFASLLGVGLIISRELKSWSDAGKITGKIHDPLSFILFTVACILLGIGVAILYRWHLDTNLFPRMLMPFSIVAISIGSAEELVFRGFIQGQVSSINKWFPAVFGALSHTAYKCCLFLSPVIQHHTDILFLAEGTFAAGIILGIVRQASGSVWPAVLAHAIFDILVYGENLNPPFWVW